MTRLSINKDVLRNLALKSKNQCAFPGCIRELITLDNEFVGQVCHIEAANSGGERYNPNQTDEERRSVDNILLLCYEHHKITDNVTVYTVDKLKKIKYDHENCSLKDIDENRILKSIEKLEKAQNFIVDILKSHIEQNTNNVAEKKPLGYNIKTPNKNEVWLPEQNMLYRENLPNGYFFEYMMRGDILCLTNGFPDGAEAYYEITEDGAVNECRMPYPISDYKVIIPDDMLVRTEITYLPNGLVNEKYILKYGKTVNLKKTRNGILVEADIQARLRMYHHIRELQILGRKD